jgi:hypothetical protein
VPKSYRDPALLGLLLAAYAAHLLEEWFGGFPEWVALVVGSPLPRVAFVAVNAVAFVLLIVARRRAARDEASGWMAIAVATVVVVNGIGHAIGAVATRAYAPGVATGLFLYLPIGTVILMRARAQASPATVRQGVLIGLAIHALVVAVAYVSARAAAG